MSYAWIGAPAVFNGTNSVTGGSSCMSHPHPLAPPLHSATPPTNTQSLTDDTNLNQWFQSGDQAYIIVASAMVLVMVPGLGFLYSGLARRKSALSMIWACMASMSVITFQWYFWGYSLAFSQYGTSGFIGDLKKFGLRNTLAAPSQGSPLIPDLLYSFYQVSLDLHRLGKYTH